MKGNIKCTALSLSVLMNYWSDLQMYSKHLSFFFSGLTHFSLSPTLYITDEDVVIRFEQRLRLCENSIL